jgi:hypothetical protein
MLRYLMTQGGSRMVKEKKWYKMWTISLLQANPRMT